MIPFWHGALLYADDEAYLDGIVPFVGAGVDAGEAVLVAVPQVRLDLIRSALPTAKQGRVRFEPMEAIGRNPARIIPAWRRFLTIDAADRPARGVGEPIWPTRTTDELAECAFHESLLNLAFADDEGFRLLCPYDTTSLTEDAVASAHENHPHLDGPLGPQRSERFGPGERRQLTSPLREPPADAVAQVAAAEDLRGIRHWVGAVAAEAGLDASRVDDLVLASSEAVTNSIRYGGGRATVRVWVDPSAVVCEVRDEGALTDPMAGRVEPERDQLGGRGLWLINQLCDLVQIRPVDGGQVLRMQLGR